MKVNLFDIDPITKQAKITKHVQDIWYLREIVNKYGNDIALKLFQIFDKVHDLSIEHNPFANLPEDTKYETILRTLSPEIVTEVDMDDIIIEQALDLVGELYQTQKSRAYKAIKVAYDNIIKKLEYTDISLLKEDGNMGEINKALDAFENLNKKMSTAYKELEEEMNITQVRGGGKVRRKPQEDLE